MGLAGEVLENRLKGPFRPAEPLFSAVWVMKGSRRGGPYGLAEARFQDIRDPEGSRAGPPSGSAAISSSPGTRGVPGDALKMRRQRRRPDRGRLIGFEGSSQRFAHCGQA